MIPGIRNSFCWDRESLQSLVHFGRWILLSTAFSFFAMQADRLILGKLISFSLLGVYGIAYSVSDIPRAVISAFSNRVGYPFIAKMVHLPIAEFRKVFLQYRLRVLVAGAVLLSLMVHLGGFLVTRVYDHRYHAASWMVPVLALGLWHTLMYQTTMPALLSLGKSQYQAIGNAFYFAAVVTAIPLAFHFYGMFGAVVAVAAGDLPFYFVLVCRGKPRGRLDVEAGPSGNWSLSIPSRAWLGTAKIHCRLMPLQGALFASVKTTPLVGTTHDPTPPSLYRSFASLSELCQRCAGKSVSQFA